MITSVAVIGVQGAHLTSIAAAIDAFAMCNHQIRRNFVAEPMPVTVPVHLLSVDDAPITLSNGKVLAADATIHSRHGAFGLIHVAAFDAADADDLGRRCRELSDLAIWIARQKRQGALVSATGAAALLLADAGAIGCGGFAATGWIAGFARERSRGNRVDSETPFVEDGDVFTAASWTGEVAMMLRLVERLMAVDVAAWLSDWLGADRLFPRHAPLGTVALTADVLVQRAQVLLLERFARKVSMEMLAADLSVSPRTLHRRFIHALGMSPHDYLQTLRMDAAQYMLKRSTRSIDRICHLVGYSDQRFFRTLFHRHTGITPAEFRARHATVNVRIAP